MRLCVTGHRPKKLGWGYDYASEPYVKLKNFFKELIKQNNVTDVYTGMAQGVDTVMSFAVLELKHEGYAVKLHSVIHCSVQCAMWADVHRKIYYDLLEVSDTITGVLNAGYIDLIIKNVNGERKLFYKDEPDKVYSLPFSNYVTKRKNIYLVDNSDSTVAIWNGSPSGTSHCVEYSKSLGHATVVFRPDKFI